MFTKKNQNPMSTSLYNFTSLLQALFDLTSSFCITRRMGASNSRGSEFECCMGTHACCDFQAKENTRLSFIKPPAGFSYFNATTKDRQISKDDHEAAWQHANSGIHGKEKQKMVEHMLQGLAPIDNTPHSSSEPVRTKSDRIRQSGRRSSQSIAWKQEIPIPLPDWTTEDQQTLIDVMEAFPRAGRDDLELELGLVQVMRKLPHRHGEDCHRCFRHVQGSRVALFRK
jgi:hypothetical protein